MKKQPILLMLITLVLITFVGYMLAQSDSETTTMMADNMSEQSSIMHNSNSNEYKEYSQLVGEDYDRAFVTDMIEHHQGAVDMARLALSNAEHIELKNLANEIISAQSKEINDLKSWQIAWGYPPSNGDMMMDHSAMDMAGEMGHMTDSLKNLQGEAFDKKFIELMIEHHQSAIDMAISGKTNAYHDEIKALSESIVTAQSSEIRQMKQWQKDWNY